MLDHQNAATKSLRQGAKQARKSVEAAGRSAQGDDVKVASCMMSRLPHFAGRDLRCSPHRRLRHSLPFLAYLKGADTICKPDPVRLKGQPPQGALWDARQAHICCYSAAIQQHGL